MTDAGLGAALERLERGAALPDDAATVRAAIAGAGIGAGAVKVGRDANGATIQTDVRIGDNCYHLSLTPELLEALQPTPPASTLFNLPDPPREFVGRIEEEVLLLETLSRGQQAQAIVGVRGIGGVGKSALAARVARQLALQFPDARFAIDLRGTHETPVTPRAAMEDVIRRFEPLAQLPDDADQVREIYRGLLGGKRALIILDNARDAEQVAPLLPPAPAATIITARALIALPGGTAPIRLRDLSRGEAVKLLAALLAPREAPADELDDLARSCVDHQLALTVAGTSLAARREEYSVAGYVAEIEANREALRLEGVPDHDVMGSLDLSLRAVTAREPELAEHWRDLSVFVGAFDAARTAAVAGLDTEAAALTALRRLADLGFVESGGTPGRYRLHDLMRALARRGQPEDRFNAAADRHDAAFLAALAAANDLYLRGGRDNVVAALEAFDRDRADIEAGRRRGAAKLHGGGDAGMAHAYANAGAYVINLRLHPRERIAWMEDALASARATGNRQAEGNALGNLGIAHLNLGDARKAIEYHEQALNISREIGDRRVEGNALGNLGSAHFRLGDAPNAIEFHEQALFISREIGDRLGEGSDLANLGIAYRDLGQNDQALAVWTQALAILEDIGSPTAEMVRGCLAGLGDM